MPFLATSKSKVTLLLTPPPQNRYISSIPRDPFKRPPSAGFLRIKTSCNMKIDMRPMKYRERMEPKNKRGKRKRKKKKKRKLRYVMNEFKRSKTRLWHKRSFCILNRREARFEPHDKSKKRQETRRELEKRKRRKKKNVILQGMSSMKSSVR